VKKLSIDFEFSSRAWWENGGQQLWDAVTEGFDGSGVHCHGEALNQVIDAGFIPEMLPEPAIDPEVKAEVFDYFRARRSPRARLRALAARLFG